RPVPGSTLWWRRPARAGSSTPLPVPTVSTGETRSSAEAGSSCLSAGSAAGRRKYPGRAPPPFGLRPAHFVPAPDRLKDAFRPQPGQKLPHVRVTGEGVVWRRDAPEGRRRQDAARERAPVRSHQGDPHAGPSGGTVHDRLVPDHQALFRFYADVVGDFLEKLWERFRAAHDL